MRFGYSVIMSFLILDSQIKQSYHPGIGHAKACRPPQQGQSLEWKVMAECMLSVGKLGSGGGGGRIRLLNMQNSSFQTCQSFSAYQSPYLRSTKNKERIKHEFYSHGTPSIQKYEAYGYEVPPPSTRILTLGHSGSRLYMEQPTMIQALVNNTSQIPTNIYLPNHKTQHILGICSFLLFFLF